MTVWIFLWGTSLKKFSTLYKYLSSVLTVLFWETKVQQSFKKNIFVLQFVNIKRKNELAIGVYNIFNSFVWICFQWLLLHCSDFFTVLYVLISIGQT